MRAAAFAAAIALLATGCATIMHGSRQDVGISSSPTGAAVSIDNEAPGKTPMVAKLTRKDHHTVKITMDGYQPFEMKLTRKMSGWVWGNIIFGGLPGLAVDAITGALYKVSPEDVNATLAKADMGIAAEPNQVYIAVTLRPDPSWQRIGTLAPEFGSVR